ncbi:MAG TPA: hypothetical protein VNT42_12575 [Sphingomonas sp.]|nr:hypothetical protein [Sphingomonas sp.]
MTQALDQRSRAAAPWLISAMLLFGASLAARFPGVAMYDSVAQYEQSIDGAYADWHPPIMARAWALLNHLHPGTEPFFVIQMILWWGGLGLLSIALGRRQKHGAAALVLLVGIAPLWLGWATVVLKDAQMACCLVAATGLAAYWRMSGRAMPRVAKAIILLLLGYATMVRGNAVFATIPFAFALLGRSGRAGSWAKTGAMFALILGVLALNPLINHRLLRAEDTGIARTPLIYDLVGMAHFARLQAVPGVSPVAWADAERRHCYTPYFWNPFGEPRQCGAIGDAMFDVPHLPARWAGEIARHPIAYVVHRAGHLNANLRFWVGPGEPDARPPIESEPNQDHLGARSSPAGRMLVAAADVMARTPLGWPVIWLAIAIGLLWADKGEGDEAARIGRALALSAASMSASFAIVSVASDLRYHLWSMVDGRGRACLDPAGRRRGRRSAARSLRGAGCRGRDRRHDRRADGVGRAGLCAAAPTFRGPRMRARLTWLGAQCRDVALAPSVDESGP